MIRKTSIETYQRIKENGLLSARRFEVYDILFFQGPMTAHEIVKAARIKHPLGNQTGWNARLSEMKAQGCVDIVGEKKNEISNQLNYLWDVTEKEPVKFEKPKKQKCPTCKGCGFIETVQGKLF